MGAEESEGTGEEEEDVAPEAEADVEGVADGEGDSGAAVPAAAARAGAGSGAGITEASGAAFSASQGDLDMRDTSGVRGSGSMLQWRLFLAAEMGGRRWWERGWGCVRRVEIESGWMGWILGHGERKIAGPERKAAWAFGSNRWRGGGCGAFSGGAPSDVHGSPHGCPPGLGCLVRPVSAVPAQTLRGRIPCDTL